MTWFEELKRDLKQAGYVRLLCDIGRSGDDVYYGNMEAFYYKDAPDPRAPGSWSPAFWGLLGSYCYKTGRYKIGGGAGNGQVGVHQHQVTIPEAMMFPALEGYTVWDFEEEVDEKRLVRPIFSYLYSVPCVACALPLWDNHNARRYHHRCDNCTSADD